jgi:hypothetical protein
VATTCLYREGQPARSCASDRGSVKAPKDGNREGATLPFVGRGPGSETIGRAVFGIDAVLMWVFFVVFVMVSVERLRRT